MAGDVPPYGDGPARKCRDIVPARGQRAARQFEQLIRAAEEPVAPRRLPASYATRVAGDEATAAMLADN